MMNKLLFKLTDLMFTCDDEGLPCLTSVITSGKFEIRISEALDQDNTHVLGYNVSVSVHGNESEVGTLDALLKILISIPGRYKIRSVTQFFYARIEDAAECALAIHNYITGA